MREPIGIIIGNMRIKLTKADDAFFSIEIIDLLVYLHPAVVSQFSVDEMIKWFLNNVM